MAVDPESDVETSLISPANENLNNVETIRSLLHAPGEEPQPENVFLQNDAASSESESLPSANSASSIHGNPPASASDNADVLSRQISEITQQIDQLLRRAQENLIDARELSDGEEAHAHHEGGIHVSRSQHPIGNSTALELHSAMRLTNLMGRHLQSRLKLAGYWLDARMTSEHIGLASLYAQAAGIARSWGGPDMEVVTQSTVEFLQMLEEDPVYYQVVQDSLQLVMEGIAGTGWQAVRLHGFLGELLDDALMP